jgi:hypothetical protein
MLITMMDRVKMPFVSTSSLTGDGVLFSVRLMTAMIYAIRMTYNVDGGMDGKATGQSTVHVPPLPPTSTVNTKGSCSIQ